MDYLNIIAQILGSLGLMAAFFWAARSLYVYYANIRQVEAIHKVEAKVAVLRMLLRAKLRKHAHAIENQFKNDKVFLTLLQSKFEEICNYEFTTPAEYSRVITSLNSLYEVIDVELQKKSPTLFKKSEQESKVQSDQKEKLWYKPIKYGKTQVLLIKDISETTAVLKNLIDLYIAEHSAQVKNKFKAIEPVVLPEIDSLHSMLETLDDNEQIELEEKKAA